jgi:hypothetical protein
MLGKDSVVKSIAKVLTVMMRMSDPLLGCLHETQRIGQGRSNAWMLSAALFSFALAKHISHGRFIRILGRSQLPR